MKGFIEVTNVDKGASGEKWLVNVSQISYVAPKSGSYGAGNCIIHSGVAGFSLNIAETYQDVIAEILIAQESIELGFADESKIKML